MAISKIILNGVTQMDVTQTTVDSSSLQTGYTAIGNDGELVNGSAILGGGGITPTGTISITANNSYDITQYATADVNVPDNTLVVTISYNSTTGQWEPNKTFNELQTAYNTGKTIVVNTSSDIGSENSAEGAFYQGNTNFKYWIRSWQSGQISEAEYTYSSGGLSRTDGFYTYYDTSGATISSNSQLLNNVKAVGSDGTLYTGNIPTRTTANLSVSGPTVTVEAGYYETNVSKSISISTATTDIIAGQAYLETTATNDYGWRTTVTLPAGYYEATTLTATCSSFFPAPSTPATDDKVLLGYEAYDKDGKKVTGSMPFNYFSATLQGTTTSVIIPAGYHNGQGTVSHSLLTLPSAPQSTTAGVYKSTISRSTATRYLVIPEGYNSSTQYYTISGVSNGIAGTPTATKGTVSNHSINVTPSVINYEGYISGGTITGTPVSVSASELVSGSQTITSNGIVDVTNLASVTVNVAGGSSAVTAMQVGTETLTISSAQSYLIFEVDGEPTSFSVISTSTIATGASPYKVASVVYDGTTHFGEAITNTSNAQVSYLSSNIYHNYNNGNLEVIINNVNYTFQAGSYALVYTYGGGAIDTKDIQVGSGATSITFTGLEDEPAYWSCAFKSNFSTSNGYQRVIAVANNGTNIYGMEMDSSAKYSNTHWTASYSSGSLTITSSGTNAGGYFHQPGYYQLTYAYDDGSNGNYQTKTVTPNTTIQNITADSQYDALKKVIVNPIPDSYVIPSGNLSITSNANNIDVSEYATVSVNVPTGGGTISYATKTVTASNYPTSLSFTGLSGEPKAFSCRLNAQVSSSGSTAYYYITGVSSFGATIHGNCFRVGSTRRIENITSGYSSSYSNGTLTITSRASSRATSPGAFYSGSYELLYAY